MDVGGVGDIFREYTDIPPLTKIYTTTCFILTCAVQVDLLTPFHLYFNASLIFVDWQIWRLLTSFCFFGTFGFSFLFNMIFTYRYCRSLEEDSFRGRPADFAMMFIFGFTLMTICGIFVHMVFLGHAFTMMMVYVWSRRNPSTRMNFFGMITFNAPYLPYVLLALTLLLGNSILVDIMGIAVGHFYYFLEDVFPRQQSGFKVLHTPELLRTFFNYAFSVDAAQMNGDAFDPVDLHEEAGAAGGFDLRHMARNTDEVEDDDGMTSETDSNSYSDIGQDEDVRAGNEHR